MSPVILTLFETLFFLLIFLFLSIFVFYLPGYGLIGRWKKLQRADEKIFLSYATGLIILLIISLVTSAIHLRFLSPIILAIIDLFVLYKFKMQPLNTIWNLRKEKALLGLLFLGIIVQGFINFPSGFNYQSGDLYWSAQGHDGLWHVTIIRELERNFPPKNPLYAGESLYNYHFFTDVIMAETGRIFPFFSIFDLYYRFFTFLISSLMGLGTYCFLTTWRKNRQVGYWGIFFTYLVGSFGYWVDLIQKRSIWGSETVFWAAQGNTIIGNPPHAFCYVFFPAFLTVFYYHLKKPILLTFLCVLLLGAFLAGFKVSAGVVVVAGIGAMAFFALLKKTRFDLIILCIFLVLTNFFIFKLITKGGESFLIFQPWWFIRTMIVAPDRVNWIDLELKRQFYLDRGGWRSWLRVIQFESLAFLIFLFGNLGTRIIGFLKLFQDFFSKRVFAISIETFLFSATTISFLIPLFFVQKGVAYNLIQFMQYFLLFFGFWAAISTEAIIKTLKSKTGRAVFILILTALSVPTVIGNLWEFYGKNPLAIVTNQEITALNYLKSTTNDQDIILTKPFNPYGYDLYPHQPWPIYAWTSTAYISAYTARQTYLTDEGQMEILGLNPKQRLAKMEAFFNEKTPLEEKTNFLKQEKITFLYLRKEEIIPSQIIIYPKLGLKEVFSNNEVVIYRLGSV